MNLDKLRRICLSYPDATEQVQWGTGLVFKVDAYDAVSARLTKRDQTTISAAPASRARGNIR